MYVYCVAKSYTKHTSIYNSLELVPILTPLITLASFFQKFFTFAFSVQFRVHVYNNKQYRNSNNIAKTIINSSICPIILLNYDKIGNKAKTNVEIGN